MRLRYNITTADTRACEDANIKTEAACKAAGKIWSAAYVTASMNDNSNGNDGPNEALASLPVQNPTVDLGGFLNEGGTATPTRSSSSRSTRTSTAAPSRTALTPSRSSRGRRRSR